MTVSAQRSKKAAIKASVVLLLSILPYIYFFAHYQNGECDSEWRDLASSLSQIPKTHSSSRMENVSLLLSPNS